MHTSERTGLHHDSDPVPQELNFAELLKEHLVPQLNSEQTRLTILKYAARLRVLQKTQDGNTTFWAGNHPLSTNFWLAQDIDSLFLSYLRNKSIKDPSLADLLHILAGPKHFVDRIVEKNANCLDLSLGSVLAHYLQQHSQNEDSPPLLNTDCFLVAFNVPGEKFPLMETAKVVAKKVLHREYQSHYGLAYTKAEQPSTWLLRTRYGSFTTDSIRTFLTEQNSNNEKIPLKTKRRFIDDFERYINEKKSWPEVEKFLENLDEFPRTVLVYFLTEFMAVKYFSSLPDLWTAITISSSVELSTSIAELLQTSLTHACALYKRWNTLSATEQAALASQPQS